MMNEPETHHIGHPFQRNTACCGIAMPPEQGEVRPRGDVRICADCAKVFKELTGRGPGR